VKIRFLIKRAILLTKDLAQRLLWKDLNPQYRKVQKKKEMKVQRAKDKVTQLMLLLKKRLCHKTNQTKTSDSSINNKFTHQLNKRFKFLLQREQVLNYHH